MLPDILCGYFYNIPFEEIIGSNKFLEERPYCTGENHLQPSRQLKHESQAEKELSVLNVRVSCSFGPETKL